ncbi:hypothetical protein PJ262_02140 [Streptococcus dysgalactiae]|uniref:hypothetical protein n=1 Tax=Streptococcus dysgalactiae TaxID=1334 RepID=UPI0012A89FB6|nr:hypothetical protein [Streptococcus dysgalactiae]QGH03221.1 hypothetical protein EA458_01020 [Streptococcus dysgalactiae subsp. dysgalactiae]QGH03556.1 hypothetical protein EA458_02925 [Streptococcus dysgalactiae subsp. dysgalactiae]QGH04939.1 hypothetical protein EA458_11080 [Streptococcus dysgalactiae subsp. dysgalactiae]WCE85972.1 hypothetical protein PMN45_11770 [Streptococcus dysgalactiae]WCE86481.1 hypothetical protein PMN45_02540 [Streptococcus dysgalactiae]
MKKEEVINQLLDTIERQDDRLYKQTNVIVMLITGISILLMTSIALQSHYEPQINGLRAQLVRTQKQLKRASEQNQRQTKRIAELTGNGG